MNTEDEFKQAIRDFAGTGNQAALRWAVVDEVHWEDKTMTVTGVADDLPYYDVQLGLGAMMIKPAVKSNVLIGIIEGDEASAFLLAAEEIAEIEVRTSGKIEVDGGNNGGLVLSAALAKKLNTLEEDINKLKTAVSEWTPVTQDGGGALKTALSGWAGEQLTKTVRDDLENNKIRQ